MGRDRSRTSRTGVMPVRRTFYPHQRTSHRKRPSARGAEVEIEARRGKVVQRSGSTRGLQRYPIRLFATVGEMKGIYATVYRTLDTRSRVRPQGFGSGCRQQFIRTYGKLYSLSYLQPFLDPAAFGARQESHTFDVVVA